MKPTKRPGTGRVVATPKDEVMLELLGGASFEGVTFTRGQFQAIQKLYGFTKEPPNKKPPPPVEPTEPVRPKAFTPEYAKARAEYDEAMRKYQAAVKAHANWRDPRKFMQVGADRNAMRFARQDGLRIMAWLAKHMMPGADPLKTLVQMASDAGWGDVDPDDLTWAENEQDEQDEEDAAE
jgi:hypothetical protein